MIIVDRLCFHLRQIKKKKLHPHTPPLLRKELVNFYLKVQTVNTLGFISHMVCVTTTQLCHYSTEAATDHADEHGYVPVEVYIQINSQPTS